jgi:hypothetical protein
MSRVSGEITQPIDIFQAKKRQRAGCDGLVSVAPFSPLDAHSPFLLALSQPLMLVNVLS